MSEQAISSNQFNITNRRSDGTYYNLQKLNQKHLEIIRLLAVGMKDHEIADELDCSKAMVKYTKESPVAQRKIELLKGKRDSSAVDIRKRIQAMAPIALDKYQEILEKEEVSESVRSKVAADVLDRAGYNPVNKTLDVGKYTEDKIEDLKRRARENGMVIEETEEAEYEEIDGDNL